MTPESQIITRAQYEFNAGALAERYDLIRQQLAFQGGQIVVGAEARAQHETAQREQQELQKQWLYEERNARFITKSVLMLPSVNDPVPNDPENYLKIHGLMDRVVWVKAKKYHYSAPHYVIGANPDKGLVTHYRHDTSINVFTSRQAKKLAGHFSSILKDADPTTLEEIYNPSTDSFTVTQDANFAKTLKWGNAEVYSRRFPDAHLHEFGIVSHLMHLAAIFNVQHAWGNLLETHTEMAPKGEVSQLKAILEAHFGKQPEIPGLQTEG